MATSARLDELKKKFDENPRRYFAPLANECRKQGDLAQAIALCRTHLPNQPGHISGHIVLAQALYESRELAESRQAFESALELDPENLIALRYLGDIAREGGAPAVAQAWYQRVLEADPRNDEIAQLLRDVGSEAEHARAELASRPTPPANDVIDTEPVTVEQPQETVAVDVSRNEDVRAGTEAAASSPQAVAPAPEPATPAAPFPEYGEDPFFSHPTPLGELEAVAEPSIDDWFGEAPREATSHSAPPTESLFPDLSQASSIPPASTSARDAGLDAFSADWEPAAPPAAAWAPVPHEAPVEPEPSTEVGEPSLASAPAEPVNEPAVEESFIDEFPFAPAAFANPTPAFVDAVEPEAPTQEWSAAHVPADAQEAADWDADVVVTGESASPWDASPMRDEPGLPETETVGPRAARDESIDEPPARVEFESDPLLGHAPALGHVVPEEPPAPFVTETMAELYLQQGFNEEALAIYRQLLVQSPADASLQRRVAALEQGSESAVVDIDSTTPAADDASRSVRAFFARFATRARRGLRAPGASQPNEGDAEDESGGTAIGGIATREEALTRADDAPATLTQVFATRAVSTDDAQAAATLASAFGLETRAPADGTPQAGELSLEHLFRDVQARSAGAVTAGEYADDPSPASPDERQDVGVESHADIEQFTAWLEGLKKK
ncbi:MAG: tetratricopeptide repeat protein [Gemmatimonadaceae bacterium]